MSRDILDEISGATPGVELAAMLREAAAAEGMELTRFMASRGLIARERTGLEWMDRLMATKVASDMVIDRIRRVCRGERVTPPNNTRRTVFERAIGLSVRESEETRLAALRASSAARVARARLVPVEAEGQLAPRELMVPGAAWAKISQEAEARGRDAGEVFRQVLDAGLAQLAAARGATSREWMR